MNFDLIFSGLSCHNFDIICKLFLETAEEADYGVNTYCYERLSPGGYAVIRYSLKGSAKKDFLSILVDFDEVYNDYRKTTDGKLIILSPSTIGVEMLHTKQHYWALVATLFRIIHDLSPAFITGYLLDKNLMVEQNLFKQYLSTSLPFSIQELIK